MAGKFWLFYLGLILLRLYFAVQKSYIHPDEMFQGSEVIVGNLYDWDVIHTWEFVSSRPIRSIVPIYLFQSPLLYHLRMMLPDDSTTAIFYTLRFQQFLWSLCLDILLYAISRSKNSLLLFASSYTTLTYQTHAFSNSWESILVLATLYASQGEELSLMMGSLACLGVFTRVSFAAFMVPLAFVRLKRMFSWNEKRKIWIPDELQIQFNAFSALTFVAQATIFIYLDSRYYFGQWLDLYSWHQGAYTVWNNLMYNSDANNLAQHGLHPRYQHVINALVLLGPALLLVKQVSGNLYSASMAAGFLMLSLAPHQEARFLLPCIVLFFASLRVRRVSKKVWAIWLTFNFIMAVFLGVFHQCGVVPAALHISQVYPNASITWTKSYPAPKHLLGPDVDIKHVYGNLETTPTTDLYVAPLSHPKQYHDYTKVYSDDWHVNLDDFDVLGLQVFQRRGLGIYKHRDYKP